MKSLLFIFLHISSIFVFVVQNPVYAAFWLILTFFSSAALLWLFNSSFFALIYIIIYVGAIAVLFLFVLMMLDIKNTNTNSLNQNNNIFLKSLTWGGFLFAITLLSKNLASLYNIDSFKTFNDNFIINFDVNLAILTFGQILYNYYIFCVLISGIILLIAILGAIVLTLQNNPNNKVKIVNRQLSRSDNFLSFFK